MGFFDKFINKFTNKASDKLADKAINKIFGKDKESKSKVEEPKVQETQPEQTPVAEASQNVQQSTAETVSTPSINPAQMAMYGAMMGQATQASMAQANEVMKYLIFNDKMEVIGVKDDAPDFLKMAYKSGKFND